jgi:hypothetical protein
MISIKNISKITKDNKRNISKIIHMKKINKRSCPPFLKLPSKIKKMH